MIDESRLRETLLYLAEDNRTNYIMIASLTNEIAALREAVRGLDPTFREVLEMKRDESQEVGEEHIHNALSEYDRIIQRLKDRYVC
jgi:hypothetical protein